MRDWDLLSYEWQYQRRLDDAGQGKCDDANQSK
jgi:hypothetical protein